MSETPREIDERQKTALALVEKLAKEADRALLAISSLVPDVYWKHGQSKILHAVADGVEALERIREVARSR